MVGIATKATCRGPPLRQLGHNLLLQISARKHDVFRFFSEPNSLIGQLRLACRPSKIPNGHARYQVTTPGSLPDSMKKVHRQV